MKWLKFKRIFVIHNDIFMSFSTHPKTFTKLTRGCTPEPGISLLSGHIFWQIHPRLDHISAFVNQSQRSLGRVAALLECHKLHHHYHTALSATCDQAM